MTHYDSFQNIFLELSNKPFSKNNEITLVDLSALLESTGETVKDLERIEH